MKLEVDIPNEATIDELKSKGFRLYLKATIGYRVRTSLGNYKCKHGWGDKHEAELFPTKEAACEFALRSDTILRVTKSYEI